MSLKELIDNSKTDKDTTHSYLDLYQSLLEKKSETATKVLEIGIHKGGSIKMWDDFFINADVYAVDILPTETMWEELLNKESIHLYNSEDAYNPGFVQNEFIDNNFHFDVILDDGPHTLQSMIQFIKIYLPLLKSDGILIIEDVQQMEWLDILKENVPENFKKYIYTYDLRKSKDRYDDIVFCINKSL
jgi:hypothetical protein